MQSLLRSSVTLILTVHPKVSFSSNLQCFYPRQCRQCSNHRARLLQSAKQKQSTISISIFPPRSHRRCYKNFFSTAGVSQRPGMKIRAGFSGERRKIFHC
ncbi:unnamed protein product, partial [Linum tenue]